MTKDTFNFAINRKRNWGGREKIPDNADSTASGKCKQLGRERHKD